MFNYITVDKMWYISDLYLKKMNFRQYFEFMLTIALNGNQDFFKHQFLTYGPLNLWKNKL